MVSKLGRRSFLKWAGVGVTGAVLAGCVAPQAPAEGGGAPSEAAIEIGWARHGADADLNTEGALADLFAAKHPGVVVSPIVLPWEDYNTKIPVMVAGGTAPDTFGCHPALLTETYNANGLIPVSDYIDAHADAVNYDDVVYHGDALYDGKIVGLPQKSCTHQLRFNKALYAEAGLKTPAELYWESGADGWNWNTFVEHGMQLTKDLDGDGVADQYFYGGQSGTSILTFIRSGGGDILNEDFTQCLMSEQAAVDAIKWMGDLVLTHQIQPPPEMQANELGINFPTGKIAVAGATTCDQVRDLREGFELDFEWDYVVLPAGSAGFRCWGDTDQIVIASSSKNPDAAWDWMLYRSSKEAWDEAYEGGIILAFSDGPTRYSIFESKAYTEPLAALDIRMIQEGYNHTIPNPYVPRSPQPYRILFTIMTTEVDNVLRGAKTAEQAAADICAQTEEVLNA